VGALPAVDIAGGAVPAPLTSALRTWAAGRDVPAPVLGGSAGVGSAGCDAWLDEQCRHHLVVLLVVDDLQWANQSSLDVLMYVLAGLAGRRLPVVTTVRAGEEGEPLRRWLADVRRFAGVGELTLGRLDRVATGEQLAGLLGGPPHQSLVEDVYTRSQGNAYLTTLLVRGLSPDARSLPAGLPIELREAATRAWHGLSPLAQALTQLVAVAGRPQRADQLREVAARTGAGGDLVPLLRDAVDGAVLDVGADGTYWFVHPLLAEVLEAGLLPEERATLHAAFAAAIEPAANVYDSRRRVGRGAVRVCHFLLRRGTRGSGRRDRRHRSRRLFGVGRFAARRSAQLRGATAPAGCSGNGRRRPGVPRSRHGSVASSLPIG
jgi:hypothetical protein